MAHPPVGGSASGARWPWIAAAAACLVAPLPTLVITRWLAPGLLDRVVQICTGSGGGGPFESHALRTQHGDTLGPWALAGFRDFVEIMGVELLVNAWNALLEGTALAALLGLAAAVVTRFIRRAALQVGVFFACAAALACALWPSALALALAACLLPAFALNFALGQRAAAWTDLGGRGRWLLVGLASALGLAHAVAPAWLGALVARCLAPRSPGLRRAALAAGRLCVVLVCFWPLCVAFLSARPLPPSPEVSRLMDTEDLYDLEIDLPRDRLIVTRKWRTEAAGGAHVIDLGNVTAPPRRLDMPSRQVEDVALDAAARRLYLIDIDTRELFIHHADTMARLATRKLSARGRGGCYLDVVGSLGRAFVAWEVDLLASYDLRTGAGSFLRVDPLVNGATNLRCDVANKVVYFTSGELTHGYLGYGGSPTLAAVDMRTLKVLRRAPAPLSDRMALAPRRRELYISAPWDSSIWVYSTPELKLLRKLPAQFAVRPLAVDEGRSLLVAGGVLTGYVEVIGLEDGRLLRRHHVGPLCRRVALDTRRRNAFVTTARGGLYMLRY